jgi:hypothetical protein
MERLLNRLFFLILPILLGLSLTFSYYNAQKSVEISEGLRSQNERLLGINDAQKESLDTTKKDIRDLKDTLLCIGMFFNYPDRINLIIDSYSPCVVRNTDTGKSTTLSFSGQQATDVSPRESDQAQSGSRSNVSPSSSNDTSDDQPPQSDTSQVPSDVPPTNPNMLQRFVSWIRSLL